MSRLKYSMSDAFLKKFLRLEGKKNHSQCGLGQREGTVLPPLAPGYLRNCSWKRSRWPCSVSAGRPAAMGVQP